MLIWLTLLEVILTVLIIFHRTNYILCLPMVSIFTLVLLIDNLLFFKRYKERKYWIEPLIKLLILGFFITDNFKALSQQRNFYLVYIIFNTLLLVILVSLFIRYRVLKRQILSDNPLKEYRKLIITTVVTTIIQCIFSFLSDNFKTFIISVFSNK